MSDEKEKDKNGEKDTNASEAADLIKELGLLSTGSNFKSEIQYINIIGSIEGHSVLPQDTKTTKYEHLIPELIAVEENPEIKGRRCGGGTCALGAGCRNFQANRFARNRRRSQHRNPSGSLIGLFVCRKICDDDAAPDSHQRHADYRRADF